MNVHLLVRRELEERAGEGTRWGRGRGGIGEVRMTARKHGKVPLQLSKRITFIMQK